jgi:hypothetical protein
MIPIVLARPGRLAAGARSRPHACARSASAERLLSPLGDPERQAEHPTSRWRRVGDHSSTTRTESCLKAAIDPDRDLGFSRTLVVTRAVQGAYAMVRSRMTRGAGEAPGPKGRTES